MSIGQWLPFSSLCLLFAVMSPVAPAQEETAAQHDARMSWWREARFGLFIHWGLYAIPAGSWEGNTGHAEWIRTTAQIPLERYDKFVQEFNPVQFDAAAWVRMAKDAGMKYIVITSKHHDGFCLFDSRETEFDVMSTPFRRDILKELAAECRKQDITMCWYHSIMDWHHPDYLPRREWEVTRSAEGADFNRYLRYMKAQLRELVTNYGDIGVLWFDGEWESTWNRALGRELYAYVRSLQPSIIINNRVGAGRSGMEGFSEGEPSAGDFGTPEQQVPARGIPGVDWESCITMNDHWGYNSHDQAWKSPEELVRMLVDVASKGGNLLLNVGPTAGGLFPQPSIDRLQAMGAWMKVNGESIYGTQASPFAALAWGRCTQKPLADGTRLYLHVFDWPVDGRLVVPGIFNTARGAHLLSDPRHTALPVSRNEESLVVSVPRKAPDQFASVVVLDVDGVPDVADPPTIAAEVPVFIDGLDVSIASARQRVDIRYTLDGTVPVATSPRAEGIIRLTSTATVTAKCFREGKPVSGIAQARFEKVIPLPASAPSALQPGLHYRYAQGDWNTLAEYEAAPVMEEGVLPSCDISLRKQPDHYGFTFTGYIKVPADGVYTFSTDSDDGSRLYIHEVPVVDNDGIHGMKKVSGVVALAAGYHPFRVTFFEKSGGDGLDVMWKSGTVKESKIPADVFYHQ